METTTERKCCRCGKTLGIFETQTQIEFTFGYGSKHDGDISRTKELCWDCYDDIFDTVTKMVNGNIDIEEYM